MRNFFLLLTLFFTLHLHAQDKELLREQLLKLVAAYPDKFRSIPLNGFRYTFAVVGMSEFPIKQLREDTSKVTMGVMLKSFDAEGEAAAYFEKWVGLLSEVELGQLRTVPISCKGTDLALKCMRWKLQKPSGTLNKKLQNFTLTLQLLKITKYYYPYLEIGDAEDGYSSSTEATETKTAAPVKAKSNPKALASTQSYSWKEAGFRLEFSNPVSVRENTLVSNNDYIEIKWPGGEFSYKALGFFLSDKKEDPKEYVLHKAWGGAQARNYALEFTNASKGLHLYAENVEGSYANSDYVAVSFAFTTPSGKLVTGDYISHKKEKAAETIREVKIILTQIYLNMAK